MTEISPAEAIFFAALALEPDRRSAYLDLVCAGQFELRVRVEKLLTAHPQVGDFLASGEASDAASAHTQDFVAQQITTASPPPTIEGTVIAGRYKLLQVIGEGGMGSVWLADQMKPVKRRVAVKLIRVDRSNTKMILSRFEAERQAIALMDHPHIARLLDAGTTDDGQPYFAMELVKGVPLTDYCDAHKLSISERLNLFQQICSAVQHAHQKGIIHRDLKPSNILVESHDGKPVPKVIDFGLAKAASGLQLTEHTLFTAFGNVMGTPTYMAPEQATFNAVDVDTLRDVYALGVILYELLTGTTPISRETVKKAAIDEMLKLVREQEAPKPSSRLSSTENSSNVAANRNIDPTKLTKLLRGDLDWVVLKALEKDRSRRYETANGLAADIQRHLSHEPVTARPPSTLYRLQKNWQRHKVAWLASGAIAGSLLVGVTVSIWQAARATLAERRALHALDELRATAPAFAEQARSLAAKEHFDEAIEKLDYAVRLRPEVAEYRLAKADLLQCQLKLEEAAQMYRTALQLQPTLTRAQESARLCNELLASRLDGNGKLPREGLAKLHLAMQQQQRPAAELMPVARLLGEEKKLLVEYWLARLKDLPVSSEKPLKDRLTVDDNGRLALDLSDTKVTDLSPLSGAPLAVLDVSSSKSKSELADISALRGLELVDLKLSNTSVKDLAPLREMRSLEKLDLADSKVTNLSDLAALRLKELTFRDCAISDLTPIRKMALEFLDLYKTRVADLSPLVGMPIKSINLSFTPVLDFSPLAHLPLEKCMLQRNRISDLSVLRKLPLRELAIWGCAEARNYHVLSEIKTLELLLIPSEYRRLPDEDYDAIGALRHHPNLRQLGSEIMSQMGVAATGAKEVFWEDWRREQLFVPQLRKTGIDFYFSKRPTGTYSLAIQNQPFRDLAILQGAPISELDLTGCPITDLSAIRDLPLEKLIVHSDVSDLSPLRSLPLKVLYFNSEKITDVTPLLGLPLKELYLGSCRGVADVAPLAEIATLEKLTVPLQAAGVEELRKLSKLQRLGFSHSAIGIPDCTVEEFWKENSNRSWITKLREGRISPKSMLRLEDGTWELDLCDDKELRDLSPLQGAPISRLYIDATGVVDLSPLRGMPLKIMRGRYSSIEDLSPLQGAPLEDFWMSGSKVADLSALRGMPLKYLYLNNTPITDLTPLRGLPLKTLEMAVTKISDVSPLAGMPLESLALNHTKVTDISPLRGMPLKRLRLSGCKGMTDVFPLAELADLELVTLPPQAKDFDFLRARGKIQRLSFTEDPNNGYRPNMEAAKFWEENDELAWLKVLQATGVTARSSRRLPDATWDIDLSQSLISDLKPLQGAPISILNLTKTTVTDLSPLRGLPLKTLKLEGTAVSDLSPLKGMMLHELDLRGTNVMDVSALRGMQLQKLILNGNGVADLEPIRGMPLANLDISGTKVTDLRPLAGMPLKFLTLSGTTVADIATLRGLPLLSVRMVGCKAITDLSPLADIKSLTSVSLPPNAKNIEFLRDIPKLERLSFAESRTQSWLPDKLAAEFWTEYDGQAWLRAMRATGVVIKISQLLADGTWTLALDGSTISNLSPLRGVPISSLSIDKTAVTDLAPLRGMPLKNLTMTGAKVSDLTPLEGMRLEKLGLNECPVTDLSPCRGMPLVSLSLVKTNVIDLAPLSGLPLKTLGIGTTKVSDLSPLAGMPLDSLNANDCPITDLSPVRGMPLTSLRLWHCPMELDMSPLADCRQLKIITLPARAKNMESLRSMAKIERIDYTDIGSMPAKTAIEFWQDYDAKKK